MENNFHDDLFNEFRLQRKTHTTVHIILAVLLALAIIALAGVSVYCMRLVQKTTAECNERIMSFMSETDFYVDYEINTSDSSLNNGGITVEK